jgi:hypothetical protein
MRHLTSSPSSSPHYISLSFTSLYAFLSSSPTTCIPHVASDVDLNSSVEPPCILCRQYRAILPKPQKISLGTSNVDLANMNVASDVGLDPAMERSCMLCRQYWTVLPKPRKAPSKMWNVGPDSKNVVSYVSGNHVSTLPIFIAFFRKGTMSPAR